MLLCKCSKSLHCREILNKVYRYITLHPGFLNVCLNSWVLQAAYYSYMQHQLQKYHESVINDLFRQFQTIWKWHCGRKGVWGQKKKDVYKFNALQMPLERWDKKLKLLGHSWYNYHSLVAPSWISAACNNSMQLEELMNSSRHSETLDRELCIRILCSKSLYSGDLLHLHNGILHTVAAGLFTSSKAN